MCLHGLSLYLETPLPLRKGRLRYILLSFAILVLSSIPVAMDAWLEYYTNLSSGGGQLTLSGVEIEVTESEDRWYTTFSAVVLAAGVAIGDCLMVSLPVYPILICAC